MSCGECESREGVHRRRIPRQGWRRGLACTPCADVIDETPPPLVAELGDGHGLQPLGPLVRQLLDELRIAAAERAAREAA